MGRAGEGRGRELGRGCKSGGVGGWRGEGSDLEVDRGMSCGGGWEESNGEEI